MTDQKRARAERVVYRAIAEAITADRTADGASKAAAERIDAIYSEGGEPVAWMVRTDDGYTELWTARNEKGARRQLESLQGVQPTVLIPLYASPPSESRLRKALEEIADDIEAEVQLQREKERTQAFEEKTKHWYAGDKLGAFAIRLRALSDTPESNDNQGGMDDG